MHKFFLIALILILVTGVVWLIHDRANQEPPIQGPAVSVRFLDDEFGNALIVQSPEDKTTLIAPSVRHIDALVGMLTDENVREVTIVVTEPSSDSAKAIAKLQDALKVERVVYTGQNITPEKWKLMMVGAKCKPVAEALIEPGGSAKLSPTVRLDVLSSANAAGGDGSCVLRMIYRGRSVLYVAELGPEGEADLISSNVALQSSVLAIGKHAGRENPSIELLSKVRPEVCVLCSNRPQSSIISRLSPENCGAALFQTSKDGIIEIVTDGRSIRSIAGGAP